MFEQTDRRAPMAAAAIKYNEDGSIAWGDMWDSFCDLALDGGPPHRPVMLSSTPPQDPHTAGYMMTVAEICRGVAAVSSLAARGGKPGWVEIVCQNAVMAEWLRDAVLHENVMAQSKGHLLLVPAGEQFTLEGEIKSVITAVAKTTHYWDSHLSSQIKSTLNWQKRLESWWRRIKRD